MEEFLSSIGIEPTGHMNDDGNYIIDIAGPNEFGKVFSKLDSNPEIEELDDSCQLTLETSSFQYECGDYHLTLLSDYEADTYRLIVMEMND